MMIIMRELKPKNKFKALMMFYFLFIKVKKLKSSVNSAGKYYIKDIVWCFKATSGKIFTCGTVAPLLELRAGFDHNYSGRENVY